EVVTPLMIDAGEVLRIAVARTAHGRAAVRAAIHESGERAVLRARDHHGAIADKCGLEVAGPGDLGFERHVIPRGSLEDAAVLAVVNFRVGVDPVGDAADAFIRPGIGEGSCFDPFGASHKSADCIPWLTPGVALANTESPGRVATVIIG